MKIRNYFFVAAVLISIGTFAQQRKGNIRFTVSLEQPRDTAFHVEMLCEGIQQEFLDFKMPVWTPGYYQRMDYARNVANFYVADNNGKELKWEKTMDNTWKVYSNNTSTLRLKYDVKTSRPFVATNYLDEERGYIVPAATFFHINGRINQPVEVIVKLYVKWNRVATGLDSIPGKKFTYSATDFDVLYDCPILAGNLEELPSFKVGGIPHRFIGYKLGEFDRVQFMNELKKIVETASGLIGHIPYKHYTFIAIGPGAGGIEHLNNTTISFSGAGLNNRESRIRLMYFIAHEYFHHYNVKRIRPVELGPFDYDKGSRTRLLWVSEGLSVYYEYLVVKRAGISTETDLFNALRNNMMNFENKPGRLYQSLVEASWNTWSDGPFGRTGDEINKTISYYDKGPVVGMLLDFKIRYATKNKNSLDDVMRSAYREYYQKRNRGFTEEEFRILCEKTAGVSLKEFFEYINTTKEIDYPSYFYYAGLTIDTATKALAGSWLGINSRTRNDSLFVSSVDWESPAWQAGMGQQDILLEIDGMKAITAKLNEVLQARMPGDKIKITWLHRGEKNEKEIVLGRKTERQFIISKIQNPGTLQKAILESWLKR